jgi:hypothetical protein
MATPPQKLAWAAAGAAVRKVKARIPASTKIMDLPIVFTSFLIIIDKYLITKLKIILVTCKSHLTCGPNDGSNRLKPWIYDG